MSGSHYPRLALMALVSFIAMYILMYAMVDRLGNVYNNVNQVFMAGLMTSVMVPIELALMSAMYPNRRKNIIAVAASLGVLAGCWLMVRNQTGVNDRQFLRSMIPHHGAAVLMCREAPIQDNDVIDLCRRIVGSQQAEIEEMESLLQKLESQSP